MNIDLKNFDCICEECKNKLQVVNTLDFSAGKDGAICENCGKKVEPGINVFKSKNPMTVFVRQPIDEKK